MQEEKLYRMAIEKWGIESQLLMLIEEMAELTHVISKGFRGQANTFKLIEELVDVEIMLEEIKIALRIEGNKNPSFNADLYTQEKGRKLKRLAELLTEAGKLQGGDNEDN
ncbi:hypothetical protein [Candidatus Pyrohabitans sp.]